MVLFVFCLFAKNKQHAKALIKPLNILNKRILRAAILQYKFLALC